MPSVHTLMRLGKHRAHFFCRTQIAQRLRHRWQGKATPATHGHRLSGQKSSKKVPAWRAGWEKLGGCWVPVGFFKAPPPRAAGKSAERKAAQIQPVGVFSAKNWTLNPNDALEHQFWLFLNPSFGSNPATPWQVWGWGRPDLPTGLKRASSVCLHGHTFPYTSTPNPQQMFAIFETKTQPLKEGRPGAACLGPDT